MNFWRTLASFLPERTAAAKKSPMMATHVELRCLPLQDSRVLYTPIVFRREASDERARSPIEGGGRRAHGPSPSCTFDVMDHLEKLNAHVRDAHITFDEPSHKYFLGGDGRNVISVTTFMKRFFQEFDGRAVIRVHGSRWRTTPGHKYANMSTEEILEIWEANRILQSGLGTRMHERFELFYNLPSVNRECRVNERTGAPVKGNVSERDDGEPRDANASAEVVPEYAQFNRFHNVHGVRPYRTEMRIYDVELRLAGSVDLIASGKSVDKFAMYDWKRSSKELSPDAPHYGRMCRSPLSHLPDTAYTHYVLQQNLYAHILRSKYAIFVEDMYLVRFHPTIKDYELVEVPLWEQEVRVCVIRARRPFVRLRLTDRSLAEKAL
ncbi:hypothetical protein CYMTET_7905 [Cymbomonas tetramitiformis]|uniref:PD-(D/E)XK endonuclease-like domain-containing protein n=1 Tax=Cymbomonas tetramitiformis TaxID=36881 RepID=A0AAE0LGE8_9CHLO|nr:hypothetical protein CYMTET_7905 [Cymbomonas tetramitiformis]